MTDPRIAFITGGTSGIGKACVARLRGDGFSVHLVARDHNRVAEEIARLNELPGPTVSGGTCDVTDTTAVDAAVAECVDLHGRIDVLVNNAGRGGGGPIADITDELWDAIVDANLTGTFRVTRAVIKSGGMTQRGWGRIINVSSTGGKQGVALATPYSASKNGVIGFTKALGLELATAGVTVNAVCPGFVETPMAVAVRQGHAQHFSRSESDIKAEFESRIPIGRYTTPEEVAALVSYLSDPSADSVTCQAMNVCGGLGRY